MKIILIRLKEKKIITSDTEIRTVDSWIRKVKYYPQMPSTIKKVRKKFDTPDLVIWLLLV